MAEPGLETRPSLNPKVMFSAALLVFRAMASVTKAKSVELFFCGRNQVGLLTRELKIHGRF